MREIAIIHDRKDNDISKNILSKISTDESLTVFTFEGYEFDCTANVKTVKIPEDLKEKNASIKNFVSKHFLDSGYRGFLHVLEDGLKIDKDPTDFENKIEEMMTKLNMKSWFNTITDPCNYNFHIYNPRMFVEIDKEDAKKVYDKKIYWTSHANTGWVCYDLSKAEYEDIRFEDSFTIAMYFIIEFLARRRNTKKQNELYYMNYYPSIEEEIGVFSPLPQKFPPEQKSEDEMKDEKERFEKENIIFQNMKVNNQADMSIEQIIEDMYATLTKNS